VAERPEMAWGAVMDVEVAMVLLGIIGGERGG
jgi:hypothetical protein